LDVDGFKIILVQLLTHRDVLNKKSTLNGPSFIWDSVNLNKLKSTERLVHLYRYFIMIWCKWKSNCGDYSLWTYLQKFFRAVV